MVESPLSPPSAQSSESSGDLTLASLAFINVTWEERKASYLDNFVPYALESLRLGGQQDAAEVSNFIQSRFGLNFPVNVAQSLLERGKRSRKVSRVHNSQAFTLAPGVETNLPDLGAKQQEYKREQVYLVRGLTAYAQDTFKLDWTEEESEADRKSVV